MKKSKYTESQLKEAVADSISMREVARKLKRNPNGGSIHLLKLKIKALGIDMSHFKGQGWCTGELHKRQIEKFVRIPLSEILVKNSTYLCTSLLKKRLLKEGLLENKCKICGQLPIWNNQPLVLQLDHIDGDRTNNTLENLRIACPNCHTQTPTFTSKRLKGIIRYGEKSGQKKQLRNCMDCNCVIKNRKAKRCVACSNRHNWKDVPKPTKINWPEINDLKKMLEESNYWQLGKKLGVSDNAVRKRIKKYS